jgi:ABC-type arginine transport system permease subunit
MLAYISIGIALCSITVCLVFGLTWAYLCHEIRHSSLLQEEFQTTVRRLIGNIGLFAIPVAVYLLDGKQSANNAEPFAFVWGACYVVSLSMLAAGLTTLIRDANRERKTGFYRFRRR